MSTIQDCLYAFHIYHVFSFCLQVLFSVCSCIARVRILQDEMTLLHFILNCEHLELLVQSHLDCTSMIPQGRTNLVCIPCWKGHVERCTFSLLVISFSSTTDCSASANPHWQSQLCTTLTFSNKAEAGIILCIF